jgi:hypothetical protein
VGEAAEVVLLQDQGWGTIRMYGLGDFQSPKISLA